MPAESPNQSTRGNFKKRPARPTASAVEYRRPLFAVGRGRVDIGEEPRTAGCDSWGRVKVIQGGVTQHHRDLLDVIRAVAEHRVLDGGGQEHLIFDVAKVRDMMGSRVNWRDIRQDLLDMIATIVQIDGAPGEWGAAFPLATFVGDAKSTAARAPHQFPAHLRRLVLSAGFSGLLERHATVTLSRDVLSRVLALKHGVSRAVARWCLSHSGEQHHELARVLASVGAISEGEAIAGREARSTARRYVSQLHEDAVGLSDLGVEISIERLHWKRHAGVFITVPTKTPVTPPLVPIKTPAVPTNPPAVPTKPPVSKEFP